MKINKKMSYSYVFPLVLIVLLIGLSCIHLYCVQSSKALHTYVFTKDNLHIPQDGLWMTVSVSKKWSDPTMHVSAPYGAQYDGILINNSDLLFRDWSAVMVFDAKPLIDSSWNGRFVVTDNQIDFTAEMDTKEVKAGSEGTFGAVMYSNNLLDLQQYTVSGYTITELYDVPLFNVILVLLAIWFISLIIHLTVRMRIRKFAKQQELDSAIIKQSMSTFTGFIDAKDTYTKGHSIRVAEYSSEIARRMKMSREQVSQIYYISLMHDCGKIGIPDAVLQKPGKLTDEEYNLIKSHTVKGDAILENFTAIPYIRDGAHFHHERYDGKGYPTGIKGDEIPLCARIIGIADAFDAMSSNRCYRKHLSDETIMNELIINAGKQFDPIVVPIMISMVEDGYIKKIQERYPNKET